MSVTEQKINLSRWTLATFYGWLAGVVFVLVLSSLLDAVGIEGMQFYLGMGMSMGVSFFQWRAMKRFASIPKTWMLRAIAGMSIPFIVMDLLPENIPYKLPLSIVLGSLAVGLLQFPMLRHLSQKAYVWIFGCLLGWTMAVGTVFIVDHTKALAPLVPSTLVLALINLILILAGGLVLGMITGLVLKKIITQPV